MKALIIVLLLTACAQPKQEAAPVAEMAEETITEEPDLRSAQEKYDARAELTEEEYLSLRKPVPDWETYNRLVRAEDGFDQLTFYVTTNRDNLDIEWIYTVYYDPKQESYYHGSFKLTNIDELQDLVKTKQDPAREVYGRDRVILVTNISPSLHIYADAYNKYQLYELELKNTIDEYGAWGSLDENGKYYNYYAPIGYGTYETLDDSGQFYQYVEAPYEYLVKWKTLTNRTIYRPIEYYPVTNGISLHNITETPILELDIVLAELANTNKNPTKDYFDRPMDIIYSEETKELYYLFKYNFYGDIAELTNKNPPMRTNIGERFEGSDIPNAFVRNKVGALQIYMF